MLLEQALNEEDEYKRLQKLSLGIKDMTLRISTLQSFNDMSSLKLLICSYPFQKRSVELIVSILFDRFKDQQFVNTFHQAAQEVAQLQEQRMVLSQRSLSKISYVYNSMTDLRKGSQNALFSKSVTRKLIEAKKFCAQYLKQIFLLANDLKMDIEKLARIFQIFIKNTQDQEFRLKIISIFDECKHDIFGNREWVTSYYEEIDQYFLKNHINVPKNIINDNISDKLTRVSFKIIDDQNSFYSDESQEEKIEEQIQKWLCDTETYDIQELNDILNQTEYLNDLIKYVTQPQKCDIIKYWDKFQLQNTQIRDNTYHKYNQKSLSIQQTIRSYKALQVLIKEENVAFFNQHIPQNVIQIFNSIYDFINDYNINANLYHIAQLIDNILLREPKLGVVQIIDLNLFFSLTQYIYNPMISLILESKIYNNQLDIININIDKYQLGSFFQEQLWKYLSQTNWFKFISQLISKEHSQQGIDQGSKSEVTLTILSTLKALSQYDSKQHQDLSVHSEEKVKLTNLLGSLQAGKTPEIYYTTNQQNWQLNLDIKENINIKQILVQDVDNLKQFNQQRNNNQIVKQYYQDLKNYKSRKSVISLNDSNINSIVGNSFQEDKNIVFKQSIDSNTSINNYHQKNNMLTSIKRSQGKILEKFGQSNSFQSTTTQQVESPGLQILTQIQRIDINDDQKPKILCYQKKSPFLYNQNKLRLKTEGNFTFEGFSSSKLRTIYPSYKTQIKNTEYEKQLENLDFNSNYFLDGIRLLQQSTKIMIEFLKLNKEKVKQTLNRLDITSICKSFLNEELFDKYFQYYLLNILDIKNNEFNISDECGVFINFIFENVIEIKQLFECSQNLCNSFMKSIEYICKIIFEIHKNPNGLDITTLRFKKTLLITTLNYGFQFIYQTNQELTERYILKYLNESVLHILIIWFFDSHANNLFQRNFYIFLNLILNQAPSSLISTIFFKIGLISSLQNAYSKLFINGIKNNTNYEDLFYYIQLITQMILCVIRRRQLTSLEKNLESMESWNILTNGKSYVELLSLMKNKFQFPFQEKLISQERYSNGQNVQKLMENKLKEKRGSEIMGQRKSIIMTKLLPLSPGLPNKLNQQSLKT
ncbi:unnamed protein product [Paramecium primaurelia]|uniref:Uncharacterized protein n=1 Tax=Paramecium primaurelia TaxID=5886 RepID=A0A8S1KFR0_PARPR|nr:unnamed protein product [Paramecium primaurelia]